MLIIGASDTIQLGLGYTIESTVLVDSIAGARHQLDSRVAMMMNRLQERPISYISLQDKLQSVGITATETNNLLMVLNSIGALRIKRSTQNLAERVLLTSQSLFASRKITLITHRSPTTFSSLTQSVWLATLPLLSMWLFACSAVVAMGTIPLDYFVTLSLGTYALLYVSLVAHEYTHIFALQKSQSPAVVTRNGWRLGILHAPDTEGREVASAIAGPAVGGAIAMLMASALAYVTQDAIWLSLGAICATCHALSLLPSFGDGWSIARVLRKGRV